MSFYYIVPTSDKSTASVKSNVLAVGVALLFVYLVHYASQIIVTCVLQSEDKERNKIKQKLLQTSRILYLFIICTMVSIYPPFYYGPHSAVLSWLTLVVVVLLHVFCVYNPSCKGRSAWSVMYLLYHIFISIWILLVLIVGYTWAGQQGSAPDQ